MFVLVLAAEADETRQAVTLLIVCLVGIAVMLALLTVWYWLFTSPKRRATRLLNDLGHYEAGALTESPDELPAPVQVAETVGATPGVPSPVSLPATEDVSEDTTEDAAVAPAGSAILSESSALMSSMLAESEPIAEPDDVGITTVEPADKTPARPPRPMRVVSSAPETIRRPDARPTGPPRRSPAPAAGHDKPRSVSGARPITDDELAKARQRRANRTRQQEGLSDDDWAAVMKSAFNHLNR